MLVVTNDRAAGEAISSYLGGHGYGADNGYRILQLQGTGAALSHIRDTEGDPVLTIFGHDKGTDYENFVAALRGGNWGELYDMQERRRTPVVVLEGETPLNVHMDIDSMLGTPQGARSIIRAGNLEADLGEVAGHYLGGQRETRREEVQVAIPVAIPAIKPVEALPDKTAGHYLGGQRETRREEVQAAIPAIKPVEAQPDKTAGQMGRYRQVMVVHDVPEVVTGIVDMLESFGYTPKNGYVVSRHDGGTEGIMEHLPQAPFHQHDGNTGRALQELRYEETEPVDLIIFGSTRTHGDPANSSSQAVRLLRSMDWHPHLTRACKETPFAVVLGPGAHDDGSDYVPGAPAGAPTVIRWDKLPDDLASVSMHYLGEPLRNRAALNRTNDALAAALGGLESL